MIGSETAETEVSDKLLHACLSLSENNDSTKQVASSETSIWAMDEPTRSLKRNSKTIRRKPDNWRATERTLPGWMQLTDPKLSQFVKRKMGVRKDGNVAALVQLFESKTNNQMIL
jgi:hypothetical protein